MSSAAEALVLGIAGNTGIDLRAPVVASGTEQPHAGSPPFGSASVGTGAAPALACDRDKEFAAGEFFQSPVTAEPLKLQPVPVTEQIKKASQKLPRKKPPAGKTHQLFHARFAALSNEILAGLNGTKASRIALLVYVAECVDDTKFNVQTFCREAGLRCSQATLENPYIPVIQAGVEWVGKKLASKWGICLGWAKANCGGIEKLATFLEQHPLEECLRSARAESSGGNRAPRRAAARAAVTAAEPGQTPQYLDIGEQPDGRYGFEVEVRDGIPHVCRCMPLGSDGDLRVYPVVSTGDGLDVTPAFDVATDGTAGGPRARADIGAPEIRRSADQAAVGGDTNAQEAPPATKGRD